MSLHGHYTTIQEKHSRLEGLITHELSRPSPDLPTLQTLKKQKLLLKEELVRIQSVELARLDAA